MSQALANSALVLARKHLTPSAIQESSARVCMADAINAYDRGDYRACLMWAEKSLSYSVGGFHADHKRAAELKAQGAA